MQTVSRPDPPPAAPQSPRGSAALTFSVLGFPVRARADFFIVFAIFGSASRSVELVAAWVAVAFVSILFHELGHALVARAFGCRSTIELHGMGGTTYPVREPGSPPVPWSGDLAISLAGPAFGLMLGAVVWLVSRAAPALLEADTGRWIVRQLLWVNVGWSLVNLAPVLPYDGGLAARAVLVRLFPGSGDCIAHLVTIGLGAAVIVAAILLRNRWGGSLWIAYLAARGAVGSWTDLGKAAVDRALTGAWAAWDARDFGAARATAERLVRDARGEAQRARAAELVVWSCLALRDAAAAKAAFDAYPSGYQPSTLLRAVVAMDAADGAGVALLAEVPEPLATRVLVPLLGAWGSSSWEDRATEWLDAATVAALPRELTRTLGSSLFYAGSYALARHVLALRFGVTGSAEDAYNVACCHARLGEGTAALAWLGRALDAGWDDGATLDGDEDLAPVRALAGYGALRARVAGPPAPGGATSAG